MQTDAPGIVCHPTPYRGGMGGTHTECADVPRVPMTGGTLAHVEESVTYGMRHSERVPVESRVPVHVPLQMSWHTQKQPSIVAENRKIAARARLSHKYNAGNLESAQIILGDPVRYAVGPWNGHGPS